MMYPVSYKYAITKRAADEAATANQYNTAKNSEAGKKYMNSMSGGEIMLDALGAGAGGLAGYTLAKILKWDKKKKLQASLIGAGLGGLGTQAILAHTGYKDALREAALYHSDTKEGEKMREAVAKAETDQRTGYERTTDWMADHAPPPGTLTAVGGVLGTIKSLGTAKQIHAYNKLNNMLLEGTPDLNYRQAYKLDMGLRDLWDNRDSLLRFKDPRWLWRSVPGLNNPQVGQRVSIPLANGKAIKGTISQVGDQSLGIDVRGATLRVNRNDGQITVNPTFWGNFGARAKHVAGGTLKGMGVGALLDSLVALGKYFHNKNRFART